MSAKRPPGVSQREMKLARSYANRNGMFHLKGIKPTTLKRWAKKATKSA